MINKKQSQEAAKITKVFESEGMNLNKLFHLQHSSLNSFHTWVTHSVHESEEVAKKTWANVVHSFPTHFKWRVIKSIK